jgi:hypothetical protein
LVKNIYKKIMKEGFNKASNKIIIEKRLSELDIAQIKKNKDYTGIAFWQTKHENLNFLDILSSLQSIEFYATHVVDYSALINIISLEHLFLNGVKNHEDLSFINNFTQIKRLDLLNLPKLINFPNLFACKNLTKVLLWNCKRITDISNLSLITNLEEIKIVDTPHKPDDLEFLLKLDNVKYISGQFGSQKANKAFEDLLAKYGKTQHRPLKQD